MMMMKKEEASKEKPMNQKKKKERKGAKRKLKSKNIMASVQIKEEQGGIGEPGRVKCEPVSIARELFLR